jgi:hypothetical protein
MFKYWVHETHDGDKRNERLKDEQHEPHQEPGRLWWGMKQGARPASENLDYTEIKNKIYHATTS